MRTLRHAALALLPVLALAACQQAEPEPDSGIDQVDPAETAVLTTIDTTAEAVHAHLEEENYQENWALWPDLEPMYQGGDPHGMLLTTYLNDAAMRGLDEMREGIIDDMPFGAVVVKENYMPDSTLAAVTVMYKHEGYDPANNDWFWVKHLADGTFEASGRVPGCIGCHGEAADRWDYLMTAQAQLGDTMPATTTIPGG